MTVRLVQDVSPPSIANLTASPDPQEQGQAVDVVATVVDSHLASVYVNVTYPDATSVNQTMVSGGGDVYHLNRAYGQVGTHAFTVYARDTFGNTASSAGTFRIVPVNGAPTITGVTATPDPSEAGALVNLTATIQDPDGISVATVGITFPDTSVTTASLIHGIGNVWYFTRAYGLLGSYPFTITATDGNASFPRTAVATGSFTVRDTTAPIANAGPDQTVPQGTLVVLDGRGSTDNTGIANYTWSFIDGTVVTRFGATPGYQFANAGVFQVTLVVQDLAGNAASDDVNITVRDITPPVLGTISITPSTAIVEAPGTATITFTASDNVGVVGAWVAASDPLGTPLGNDSVFTPPNSYAPSPWFLASLGLYSFTVSVADAAGNFAVRTVYVLSEDTTAPSFLGIGAQPATQQVRQRLVLWARVTDPFLDPSAVDATVQDPGGGLFGPLNMPYNASASRYEASFVPAALGVYTLSVTASDTSGNVASDAAAFVSQDTVAPVLQAMVVAPQPQDVGGTVDVSVRASDDFALAAVTIAIQDPSNTPIGTFSMVLGGDGKYHDARPYLLTGIYSFTVRAVDTTGNSVSVPGTVSIIDRVPPSISGLTEAPDHWEVGGTIAVNATVTDNVAVARVSLEVTDPTNVVSGNFTMVCDPQGLCGYARIYNIAGSYELRVWAVDRSGNTASASLTLDIAVGDTPTADAGPDVTIDPGQRVTFNGNRSGDDYGIVSYRWRFTYDGQPVTLAGIAPVFQFNASGSYVVTLTVDDTAGHTGTDIRPPAARPPRPDHRAPRPRWPSVDPPARRGCETGRRGASLRVRGVPDRRERR
ncbi:MAG: PKD domain-containing protein [Methanobacteriota archaeon]|nr:MAG: PKD domain-containing protein [Euryarchaeota archaeon]